jgi:hypothetical protein
VIDRELGVRLNRWLLSFSASLFLWAHTHGRDDHLVTTCRIAMASDDEDGGLDLFQEPADFYEPEKEATFATHQLLSGKEFTVRLVGHNPLWVRLQYMVLRRA